MARQDVNERTRRAERRAPADWGEAYRTLAATNPDSLGVEKLERLAEAAFWLGRPREAIAARRRAYALHRGAGDAGSAARSAWLLFHNHFDLDEIAVASGWLHRAQGHAAELPGSLEEGYVAVAEAEWANSAGDLDEARHRARRAAELSRRHADADLTALAHATEGRILVARGEIREGVALLDEAMVAAVGDELTAFITGWVYCLLVATCQELGDVRRAAEWTELAVRWCDERGQDSLYPGLCRLHRCEVQSLRGEWAAVEHEALRAAEELAPFGDYWVGEGQYLAGEIRRRRGDLRGAEEAFRRAHELGRDPQPGLALLQLARGDAAGAASMLRVALTGAGGGPLRRGRLLGAHVDAELRKGDRQAAGASTDELLALAEKTGVSLLRAMASRAQGSVLVEAGDPRGGLSSLREAHALYRALSCPYEAAEVRLLIGTAARRAGDEGTALLEWEAARTAFERLGAKPDVDRAAALLDRKRRGPRGLTAREIEVLGLVARGKTNREIAETLVISEHTVARHLSNTFRKLEVTSRSAATAFAFEHGLA